jgi:hemolysin activation/secretion protein
MPFLHLAPRFFFILGFLSFLSSYSYAVDTPNELDWSLRDKALQAQVEEQLSNDDRPSQLPSVTETPDIIEEANCFHIDSIHVESSQLFLPNTLSDPFQGKCLGKNSIELLLKSINKYLLSKGYVTARALLTEQDLSAGNLLIKVFSGAVENIEFPAQYKNLWSHAIPVDLNRSLNMRDLEQGVDNLNRLPSQNITFDIEPGNKIGNSRIIANIQKGNPYGLTVNLDDAGSEATGKYQINVGGRTDNLLFLQDSLNLSFGQDLDSDQNNTSKNYLASLSIPLGYWMMEYTVNGSEYEQLVSGDVQSFVSSGTTFDNKLKATYLMYRNSKVKWSLNSALRVRDRRGYINDTEVLVQRRNLTDIDIGASFRSYLDNGVLDASVNVIQGLDWLDAEEKSVSVQTPEYRYVSGMIAASQRLEFFSRKGQLSTQFFAQWADTPIYSLDWYNNGGRYTVRGFDSEHSISGEHGWRLKNEFQFPVFFTGNNMFIGLDIGGVSGTGSQAYKDKEIMGISTGLKGVYKSIGYDVFVAMPFIQIGSSTEDSIETGFKLTWSI